MDFFFSSRRRHTRLQGDWSSDVALPISCVRTAGPEGKLFAGVKLRSVARSVRPEPHRTSALTTAPTKIGRASCRERVRITRVAGGGRQRKDMDICGARHEGWEQDIERRE